MIHFVIGTKAQLIKTALVMRALKNRGIAYNYISTGQHHETIQDIHRNFDLPGPNRVLYTGPDIVSIPAMIRWSVHILLNTLKHRGSIFGEDRGGIVLIHGDTFSTILGALMAKAAGLKVGHIESGLRSFDIFHPFPEELTRLATFRLSDVMFCPNEWAVSNVKHYKAVAINTNGNTLMDALNMAANHNLETMPPVPAYPFGIVSLHRSENILTQRALLRVVETVEKIAVRHRLLFVLHKPTERRLQISGLLGRLRTNPNIEFRPRYGYFQFISLLKHAMFVVTDGGSNQEECAYLGKPTLLLRKATERKEGLEKHCVLSRYDPAVIDAFISRTFANDNAALKNIFSPSAVIAEYCTKFA
jgi:UDP-N-acetylglucosamine 2-epimerase (non-hydrolysing)